MMQFFLNAFRLRLRTGQRFTRFLTVGISGMIVNTFLLWMLMSNFGLLTSGAIAVEISIIFNFMLNDIYTFNDQIGKSGFIIRMLRFNGVALYGFIVHLSILWLLTYYAGMNYLLANLIGIIGATIFNYVAVLDYTWRVQSNVYYSRKIFPLKTSH